MALLSLISRLFLTDVCTTLISVVIGLFVYKLAKFYYTVFTLPPGPTPLPLLGNILDFRGNKQHWSVELERMAEKYGPVMTLWMGTRPQILVSDIDLCREAFRKNDFAGQFILTETRSDIVMADYGHVWEALRRVAHSAVQKYSTTEKLNNLAIDCVDYTIETIIAKEGLDKQFVPFDYIYNMFLNILAASAFGKRYDLEDPEYKLTKYVQKDLFREISMNQIFWEFIPFIRYVDPKFYKFKKSFNQFLEMIVKKYENHYKDYDETVIRDFCDTLITAKNEALRDGKESAPYLTDENLAMTVFDLFAAGTDTSQTAFRWALLHLLYDKDIEKKLREEIETVVGDRIPTHEDRNRCNYCMAFISEVLRHSNIVPLNVPHKAVVTSKIGDYTIPEGTQLVPYQGYILHQKKHWANPYEFIPERFLDSDGIYLTTRPKAFIPFSIGRRVCLGEKLAIADLFLVLVRFLQKTSDYEIVLHMERTKDALLPDPSVMEHHPRTFNISLNKK